MEDEDVLNSLYAELLLQQQATTAVGGGVGGDVLATLYYSLPAFFNSTRLQQPLQQQQQVPSAIPHSASSWMQLLRSQIPSLSAPFTPNPSTTTSTTSNLQPSSTAATAHSRYSSYIASLKSLTSKVPNLRADGKMTLFLRNLQEALAPAGAMDMPLHPDLYPAVITQSSPVSLQQTPVLGDSSVDPVQPFKRQRIFEPGAAPPSTGTPSFLFQHRNQDASLSPPFSMPPFNSPPTSPDSVNDPFASMMTDPFTSGDPFTDPFMASGASITIPASVPSSPSYNSPPASTGINILQGSPHTSQIDAALALELATALLNVGPASSSVEGYSFSNAFLNRASSPSLSDPTTNIITDHLFRRVLNPITVTNNNPRLNFCNMNYLHTRMNDVLTTIPQSVYPTWPSSTSYPYTQPPPKNPSIIPMSNDDILDLLLDPNPSSSPSLKRTFTSSVDLPPTPTTSITTHPPPPKAPHPNRKTHHQVPCTCLTCSSPLAILLLHGDRTVLATPYVVEVMCMQCKHGFTSTISTDDAKGRKRRNGRKDKGRENILFCGICMKDVGVGGVRVQMEGESGGDGIEVPWVTFEAGRETLCMECFQKFQFCTSCSGGGQWRTGKWRPVHLFPPGRRTCNLDHWRPPRSQMPFIVVYRISNEQRIYPATLGDGEVPFHGGKKGLDLSQVLSGVKNVIEVEDDGINHEEAINLLTRHTTHFHTTYLIETHLEAHRLHFHPNPPITSPLSTFINTPTPTHRYVAVAFSRTTSGLKITGVIAANWDVQAKIVRVKVSAAFGKRSVAEYSIFAGLAGGVYLRVVYDVGREGVEEPENISMDGEVKGLELKSVGGEEFVGSWKEFGGIVGVMKV